jgi:putative colanic acid biosynthesis UDP-glucose lipid carrier transferase
MQNQRRSLHFLRVSSDILLIATAFIGAAALSVGFERFLEKANAQLLLLSLLVIWFFTAKANGVYDEFRGRNFYYELMALVQSLFVVAAGAIVVMFLLKENELDRGFIAVFASGALVLIAIKKYILRKALYWFRKRGRNLRRILVIGAGDLGNELVGQIQDNPHFGYIIAGFLDDDPAPHLNGKYLGKISDLDEQLDIKPIDDVLITLPHSAYERVNEVMRVCEKHGAGVKIVPDYFKYTSNKFSVSMFGKFPIISVGVDRVNALPWRLVKMAFDYSITIALFLLVFWWLWPALAIAIKVNSRGPVFFRQERWGKRNKRFHAYKFRSMVVESEDVDENGEYKQARKDDPRVTRVGKFLRKTNLDELPQFLNVLLGDMSIVGPRPHPTPLNLEARETVKQYMLRHVVKPGITGWAQVNGYRGETRDPALMQKRIEHDIWYIENWTPTLDVQIVAATIWNMLRGDPNAY